MSRPAKAAATTAQGVPGKKKIAARYKPRKEMRAFHNRKERFALMVCHRRFGKTFAVLQELKIRALFKDIAKDNERKEKQCKREGREFTPRPAAATPQYAYVCPSLKQAKKNAWGYLKEAVGDIPGVEISESELWVKLPHNQAVIRIYGADDPDNLRGSYLDGVILDEFGDMKAEVWPTIVRPMLKDYTGFAVFIGTPKGKNAFWERREIARINKSGNYFFLEVPASKSGVFTQAELDEEKEDMTEHEYAREWECSFEAPSAGSFWGEQVIELNSRGFVKDCPYDKKYPVDAAWDIGQSDATAIWFYQYINGEYRVIDHYETSNEGVDDVCDEIATFGYSFGTFYLPHDAKHKLFAANGRSVVAQIMSKGVRCKIVDDHKVRDGIAAVRRHLPTLIFDQTKCAHGLELLKRYQRKYNPDKNVYSNTPDHDDASHTADAMRYLVMSLPLDVKPNKHNKKHGMEDLSRLKKGEFELASFDSKPKKEISKEPVGWTLDQLFEMRSRDE